MSTADAEKATDGADTPKGEGAVANAAASSFERSPLMMHRVWPFNATQN
jgi:hypothetical protein